MAALLEVENLVTAFRTPGRGWLPAVDGVSFTMERGEFVGLVGESGCGKSVTALSIMGLVPRPQGRVLGGRVTCDGEDLLIKTNAEMKKYRGSELAMIFQQPMTSLNPVYTIGFQLVEAVRAHRTITRPAAEEHAIDMLSRVGISAPERRMKSFPHQLSGGMRQRVMIAMALISSPKILIADEPTTALDVTIQAQILELMRTLCKDNGTATLLITHDLGVVAKMCHRVVIMYAGMVVEEGAVRDIFHNPLHPYTAGLLRSVPRMSLEKRKLYVIPGMVPSIGSLPDGCRFHPRCDRATEACKTVLPQLVEVEPDRKVRCIRYGADTGGAGGANSATS